MKPWQTLLLLLGSVGLVAGITYALVKGTPSLRYEPLMQNEEVIEWTDRKGRRRRMVIHRAIRGSSEG